MQILSKIKYIVLTMAWVFNLFGCSSPQVALDDQNYSLKSIQKSVVQNLPNGLGKVSGNRRVFYSNTTRLESRSSASELIVMKVMILGERRPYRISFEVRMIPEKLKKSPKEAFNQGEPSPIGQTLSERIANQVHEDLVKRRKTKNLFDDFRPF